MRKLGRSVASLAIALTLPTSPPAAADDAQAHDRAQRLLLSLGSPLRPSASQRV